MYVSSLFNEYDKNVFVHEEQNDLWPVLSQKSCLVVVFTFSKVSVQNHNTKVTIKQW